ncbi:hypothetical protein [Streptomyces sp. ODS28]|uniref:hypothetical protein n=1 Tax=Streptomyces sp. ODS28 TaxID=3136688 RepID=UPI0031E840FA
MRRLKMGETCWLWSARHRCGGGCCEVLSLHRDELPATLRLIFRAGPDRFIADALRPTGSLSNGSTALNLHEPGVVRLFIDEAVAHGAVPGACEEKETDGWPFFDRLIGRAAPGRHHA